MSQNESVNNMPYTFLVPSFTHKSVGKLDQHDLGLHAAEQHETDLVLRSSARSLSSKYL